MQKIITIILLTICYNTFAQKGNVIVLENDTVTDGLPYYLADSKTKKPISTERFYSVDNDRSYFKVWIKTDQVGLYSKDGKCIIPPIHKDIVALETSESRLKEQFFEVMDSPYTFVVDSKGLQIGKRYNYVEQFCGGNKLLAMSCKENIKGNSYDLKYGFLNLETKKELFECEFDAWESYGKDNVVVKKYKKWGLINSNGWGVPPLFIGMESITDQVFVCKISDTTIQPFIAVENKLLTDTCQYIEANDYHVFLNTNGSIKIYNITKQSYMNEQLDETVDIRTEQAIGRKGDNFVIIDNAGTISQVPGKWDQCSFISENVLVVRLNGKAGMMSKDGKPIGNMAYDNIEDIYYKKHKTTCYRKDTLYGIISINGTELTPAIYNFIYEPTYNYPLDWYVVLSKGKCGLLDNTGKTIIPIAYDGIINFYNGFGCVKLNNKYGAVNSKGEIIIPTEYDGSFSFDKKGKAYVSKDGKGFYINRKNKVVK